MATVGLLVLALLLLMRSVLIEKSTRPVDFATTLYAPRILSEINTPTHRDFELDEDYNKALFGRYVELLQKDLRELWSVAGPSTLFWCVLFSIWRWILTTRRGFSTFGQRTEGLRLLASAVVMAFRAARVPSPA